MLLGYARGSVGDLTFYRRNAQQITRARARQVKNPKTLAQQMQRAIMRTSVEAYKVLKELCDHSWEGIAYGAASYSEFQKRNMAMLRELAATRGENTKSFLPSGFNGLVAMPWVISKGSVGWVGVQTNFSNGVHIVFNANVSASALSEITYQGFCDAFGIEAGDQVTLVALPKRTDIDESASLKPIIARIIASPASGDMTAAMFTQTGAVNSPNTRNENTAAYTFNFSTGRLAANISSGEFIGAIAIISRRAVDGNWLRSNAVMEYANAQREGGYTLRQASMVAATEIDTSSEWYLNNANES